MRCKRLWLRPMGWLRILVLLPSALAAAPSSAGTTQWIGPDGNGGDGMFRIDNNWDAGIPGVSDTAEFFEPNVTATVTFNPGGSTTIGNLLIIDGDVTLSVVSTVIDTVLNISDDIILRGGNLTLKELGGTADVNLNIDDDLIINRGSTFSIFDGATVTADFLQIGFSSLNGGDGMIIVDGVGSSLVVNSVDLGRSGHTGTLTFQNGSTGDVTSFEISLASGQQGNVANTTGRLNVLSGASLQAVDIRVGNPQSTTAVQEGTLTVSGANSLLTMIGTSTLTIGDEINPNVVADVIVSGGGRIVTGTGEILIQNTGRLVLEASAVFIANGNIVIDGGTISTVNSMFSSLNLAGGLTLTAMNNAQLNFDNLVPIRDSTTWILQSGADYRTNSSRGDLVVGSGTNGTLIVEGTGTSLSVATGPDGGTRIGVFGSTGTVTIRDNASAFLGTLEFGTDPNQSTGILNIEDGAQVTTNSIDMASIDSSSSTAEINIGSTTNTAQLTMNGDSDLTVGAAITPSGSTTINLSTRGRLITGTGTTTVNRLGLIDINGGTLRLEGDLIINGGEVRRSNSGFFVPGLGTKTTLNDGGRLVITGVHTIQNGHVITVNSGSAYSSTNPTDIGLNGDGTLIVDGAGSSATIGGGNSHWGAGGTTARVTLRNEATGTFGGGDIMHSDNSTAIFEVQSGADLTLSGGIDINADGDAGSIGELTVTGTGSTITMSSNAEMNIGHTSLGTATLNILD